MANVGPNLTPNTDTQKKPIFKRWWFWLVVGLALLFVIVGVSSGGGSGSSDSGETQEVEPMPDVVGERLDVAISDLETFGIAENDIEIVGGGAFGVVDESNWTVCEQRPEAGSTDLVDFRLIVDRDCPTPESEAVVEETEAGDTAMEESASPNSEESAASEPDSPALFIPAARRDLRDLRKDLNDLETAIAEGGFLRVAGNQVELAFNLGQLASANPPEAYAVEWDERLAAVNAEIDAMNVLIDEDGGPGQVADAIDSARSAISQALDSLEVYEASLG